jgi:hypothetical protein
MENSYCFILSCIEKNCWKNNGKGLFATANYLKVLINDEETTLTELNKLCGVKNNVFSRTKIPSC